jgi:hypothetical protein
VFVYLYKIYTAPREAIFRIVIKIKCHALNNVDLLVRDIRTNSEMIWGNSCQQIGWIRLRKNRTFALLILFSAYNLHLRAQSSENHQEIWRGLKITEWKWSQINSLLDHLCFNYLHLVSTKWKIKQLHSAQFLRIQRGELIWLWLWTMSTEVLYRFLAGIIIWTEMMLCLFAILDYISVFRLLASRNALLLCRDPARSKLSTHQQRTNCYLRVWSF